MAKRGRYKYTKELLEPLVKTSFSIAQILDKLGLEQAGGNHCNIVKAIKEFKLSTKHFTGQGHNKGKPARNRHTKESLLAEVFKKNGSRVTGTKLKPWLLKFGFKKKEICAICKLSPIWNGKKLVLQVDHINGNHSDSRVQNLRLLCPNCHSQQKTTGRKKKSK